MKKPKVTPENKAIHESPENKAAPAKRKNTGKRNNSGTALSPGDRRRKR